MVHAGIGLVLCGVWQVKARCGGGCLYCGVVLCGVLGCLYCVVLCGVVGDVYIGLVVVRAAADCLLYAAAPAAD